MDFGRPLGPCLGQKEFVLVWCLSLIKEKYFYVYISGDHGRYNIWQISGMKKFAAVFKIHSFETFAANFGIYRKQASDISAGA
jgi:hypothetical protein